MQLVLDLNLVRREPDRIRSTLEQGDQIVVIDDFFVECFKHPDPIHNLYTNLFPLRDFPDSLLLAKKRAVLFQIELDACRPIKKEELIDQNGTKLLRQLVTFDCQQLSDTFSESSGEASRLINFNEDVALSFIRDTTAKHASLDVKKYRRDNKMLIRDVGDTAMMLTNMRLEHQCSSAVNLEQFRTQPSAIFIFYYSLLWANIKWLLNRGFENLSTKKFSNEAFDLKYIETACFFDGLLTNEDWLKECRAAVLEYYSYQQM